MLNFRPCHWFAQLSLLEFLAFVINCGLLAGREQDRVGDDAGPGRGWCERLMFLCQRVLTRAALANMI